MAHDLSSSVAGRLAAAAKLKPVERDVFVLAAHERLSNPEIAQRLGMTAPAVERVLARALRKLDRALTRAPLL